MPDLVNRKILLASRPKGPPTLDNFALTESVVVRPGEGELLCRTIYLSLDPYMRGRMDAVRSYAAPVEVGDVMVGGTVGEVLESRNPRFSAGDLVVGQSGWQDYGISEGKGLRKLDPSQAPISYALGVLGMPGMTAYLALLDIGRPRQGETVVISAAAGAVGSVAGQIAKIKGCRAVGIAGSAEKCDFVVRELGFDACVNYKAEDFRQALRAACPDGIDVYFDNVGGPVLEAVLRRINLGARIPLVGIISQYNAATLPPGPNLAPLLVNRALIQGFLVGDHTHRLPDFFADVGRWVKEGRLKYKEDVVDGLENAPRAFIGLLEGQNFGKLLVRVSEDPTKPKGT
jgi:NADPH-dependent curcumin reductase CurA